jgi:hypothetical protein
MKASKTYDGETDVELSGKVVEKKFAQGSKSEHDAIYLETEKAIYQLRRIGVNPFFDPELKKLVGKKVLAIGLLKGSMFLAKSVKKIS